MVVAVLCRQAPWTGVGRVAWRWEGQACSLAGRALEMEQADRFASASVFCNDSLMVLPGAPLGKAACLG